MVRLTSRIRKTNKTCKAEQNDLHVKLTRMITELDIHLLSQQKDLKFEERIIFVRYVYLSWNQNKGHKITHTRYYTALFVLIVILPFTLITILYSVMVCCLFLNKHKLVIHRSSENAPRRRSGAKELRMLKIAATIVIAFAVCWGPFNIIQFFHLFAPWKLKELNCNISHVLIQIAFILATANCTVNPIVCLVYLRNYRLKESLASLRSQFSNISKGSQRETEL